MGEIKMTIPLQELENIEKIPYGEFDPAKHELIAAWQTDGANHQVFEGIDEIELQRRINEYVLVPPRNVNYNKESGITIIKYLGPLCGPLRIHAQYKM